MARLSLSLPLYDFALDRIHNEVAYALHMNDEILCRFPPLQINHHGSARIVSQPSIVDISMKLHKSKATTEPDMILLTDAVKFKQFLMDLITPLLEQQKEHTWEAITKTCDATGNNIDGKGRNYWDVYIEALQRAQVKFDENGRPIFAIFIDYKNSKKKEKPAPTIDQVRRINNIIETKRSEYYAKKRVRRLA